VFEPIGPALRNETARLLGGFLRQLYLVGAFSGASEEEAYFVRIDDSVDAVRARDEGRFVVDIGLAPAEPLEFVVVRLVRADGALSVET
jgi:hypothetical protein